VRGSPASLRLRAPARVPVDLPGPARRAGRASLARPQRRPAPAVQGCAPASSSSGETFSRHGINKITVLFLRVLAWRTGQLRMHVPAMDARGNPVLDLEAR